MNKLNKFLLGTLAVILLQGGFYTNASADQSAAESCDACIAVEAVNVQVLILGPQGPGIGTVEWLIDGVPVVSTVELNFAVPFEIQPDGSQRGLLYVEYVFPNGSTLTGLDEALLLPTVVPGVFDDIVQINFTGGTGDFEGVFGKLDGGGTISFIDGTSMQSGSGIMCDLALVSDDDSDSESDSEID